MIIPKFSPAIVPCRRSATERQRARLDLPPARVVLIPEGFPMDVGLVQAIRFLPSHPERLADTYRNFVDEAVLAEQLGIDFVWTTEHHFAFDGWMPAQLPVLSFIAARTSR